jgi:hypothetical protein
VLIGLLLYIQHLWRESFFFSKDDVIVTTTDGQGAKPMPLPRTCFSSTVRAVVTNPRALIPLALAAFAFAPFASNPIASADQREPFVPSDDAQQAATQINDATLRSHIQFLADDLLEGRAPGS